MDRSPLQRLRHSSSRIAFRLLAFNVLLVFLPAAGMLYLGTYEEQLLEAQEQSMVQQGRLLAAALAGRGELTAGEAQGVLQRLGQRLTSRLRVLDVEGRLLADSSLLGPRREPGEAPAAEKDRRANWLYRVGAGLFFLVSRPFLGPEPGGPVEDFYAAGEPFAGSEVKAALAGRYGAATRVTPGQRSVTLYSAIPVADGERVMGAVLVSQSTLRLLRDLYDVRLAVFQVFLASVAVAVVLSLYLAASIGRPLQRLRQEAAELLDRRGRLTGRFRGSRRRDEIGDLARALEELSRRLAERVGTIESFAADLSHEFKNPLAAIRSATELAADSEAPEERRRFLRLVEGEVARLERLLSGVQEISAIDAHLDAEERETVVLGELLAEIVEAFRVRLGGRGARLEQEPPEGPVAVRASPDRLAQVVENLLDNAVSFSPPGGVVTVRLTREGGEAVIRVEDQGPGIPAEHRARIFDRFFRYRPGTPAGGRRAGGHHAGLGLAIVKAIVEGYGGSVAASDGAAGGARLEVRLPAS
jgi:two-component system sensor histidine kinase ChvG